MQASAKQGLNILMADGSLDDHKTVKKAARECNINHVFTSVYNGAQLLDYLFKKGAYYSQTEELPDLLIMDTHLDVIDSFEALEVMGEDKDLRQIPVYMLTRTRKEEDVMRAKGLGVKGFLQKPVKENDWYQLVRGMCEANFKRAG